MGKNLARFVALLLAQLFCASAAWAYTQVIVFGDSLSDDGNVAHRTRDVVGFSYPSSNFNYSDYRFTDDFNTDPASRLYQGTWHEQLAKLFLHLPVAKNSLDGGTDYAFGGATTKDGSQERTVVGNPFPFSGGSVSVTIDNVGKQVNDYLASHVPDPNALYIVWGGGNDLFDDDSSANVDATANRVAGLVQRLASAGARNFLVPNVPPLGAVPNSLGNPTRVIQLNVASANYRTKLALALNATKASFAARGIALQLFNLDTWLNGIRMLGQPRRYGFVNVTTPAQGESVNPDQYLYWDDIHPTTAGHFQIASGAYRLLAGQLAPLGKATNISTRAFVGTGEDVVIAGFIIAGSAPKTVIVRALGPTLAAHNVSGALADPTLTIYDSNRRVVASNDNWRQTQQDQISASGYAPAFDSESAILGNFAPGAYTAVVQGKNGSTGVALVDLYDLSPTSASNFRNLSTRGLVGTGDNVLIGGFSIAAGEPPVVVLRAIGPDLGSAGIAHPLSDPILELHDANGALLAYNDDWQNGSPTAVKAALLGPGDPRDSSLTLSLSPGNYTAIVRGKNGTTGVALVEAYRLQ